jgi:hypothetical protein
VALGFQNLLFGLLSQLNGIFDDPLLDIKVNLRYLSGAPTHEFFVQENVKARVVVDFEQMAIEVGIWQNVET